MTRRSVLRRVSGPFLGAALVSGCAGSQAVRPAPELGRYVQASGPPIWCPSGGLRTGQRFGRRNQPDVHDDVVTTRTARSFNVRTLVGLSIAQAQPIIAEHSCTLLRGVSWLLNVRIQPGRRPCAARQDRLGASLLSQRSDDGSGTRRALTGVHRPGPDAWVFDVDESELLAGGPGLGVARYSAPNGKHYFRRAPSDRLTPAHSS